MTALLIGLSACGSSNAPEASDSEPPLGVVKSVRSSADLSLPLQKYDLSIAQQELVSRAYHLTKRRCLQRFGIESTEPLDLSSGEDNLNLARRYGVIDVDVAQRWGYSGPRSASKDGKTPWNPSEKELLGIDGGTPAETRALRDADGQPLPAGGCGAEASEKLGNWDQWSAQKLSHQSYERALSDSRVLSAFRKWKTCMKAAGHDYGSPMAVLEIRWERPVGKRGEREIATALDDITCRQAANVTGIWNAAEAAYEQRHIDENPEIYSDLKRSRAKCLRLAAEALDQQN